MEKIQVKPFSDLTGREVFCLSRIRDEVFVAEQGITVPELDDQDLAAYHVYLLNEQETDALAAARFLKIRAATTSAGWLSKRLPAERAWPASSFRRLKATS